MSKSSTAADWPCDCGGSERRILRVESERLTKGRNCFARVRRDEARSSAACFLVLDLGLGSPEKKGAKGRRWAKKRPWRPAGSPDSSLEMSASPLESITHSRTLASEAERQQRDLKWESSELRNG